MLEMKCNSEEVLNTNLTKEAEACTLTRGVRGMENERDEWKTLEAQQTIERDAIRTASAQVYKQPPRPQSLQLREALNCKEANGPTGRREGPQKENQRDPRSPEEGEGRTNKKGKHHPVNKLETKSTDPASDVMDPTETPGRVRRTMSGNKSIERSSSNIRLEPPTAPKLAMSPSRSGSFRVYTLMA
ncbi:unnamed protein product [Sphagnum compactum]